MAPAATKLSGCAVVGNGGVSKLITTVPAPAGTVEPARMMASAIPRNHRGGAAAAHVIGRVVPLNRSVIVGMPPSGWEGQSGPRGSPGNAREIGQGKSE